MNWKRQWPDQTAGCRASGLFNVLSDVGQVLGHLTVGCIRGKMNALKINKLYAAVFLAGALFMSGLWAFVRHAHSAIVTEEVIRCSHNSNKGLENPLGLRKFISIMHTDGNTSFSFLQLPDLVSTRLIGSESEVTELSNIATIEIHRKIVFYQTSIQEAREIMRSSDEYYYRLIGMRSADGYAAYDKTISCE